MEVVLAGVDGGDAGVRAARFAAQRASQAAGSLLIAHVIPWSPFSVHTAEDNERRRVAEAEEIAAAEAEIVSPLLAELQASGLRVEAPVRHGHLAETLCDLAEERGAAHLVVGRLGRSRVRARLFGSTAGNLIQIATIPVTVVP